jgi:hypothetical protein
MTVHFGSDQFQVPDPRTEWQLDLDALPYCKTCQQQLRFRFQAPDYWQPITIRCDHFETHLTPILEHTPAKPIPPRSSSCL